MDSKLYTGEAEDDRELGMVSGERGRENREREARNQKGHEGSRMRVGEDGH